MSSRANSCAFAVKSASVFSANENLLFFFLVFLQFFRGSIDLSFLKKISLLFVERSVEPAFFWSFHESFINTHVQKII